MHTYIVRVHACCHNNCTPHTHTCTCDVLLSGVIHSDGVFVTDLG